MGRRTWCRGRLGLLVVHEHVHRELAVLGNQCTLGFEGDHLAVGAQRGVQAAQLKAGLGPVAGYAGPDGGVGLAVVDENVGVEVAVVGDQVSAKEVKAT